MVRDMTIASKADAWLRQTLLGKELGLVSWLVV